MLKVIQAAFAMGYFWGLSDICECSGGLSGSMCPGQAAAGCMMRLGMDLAALSDMWS